MSRTDGSNHDSEPSPNSEQKEKTSTTSRSRREFLGKVTAATVATGLVGLTAFEGSSQFRLPADDPAGGTALACPAGCEEGPLQGQARADAAKARRVNAANYEWNMPIPSHPCNNDEVTSAPPLISLPITARACHTHQPSAKLILTHTALTNALSRQVNRQILS